MRYEIVQEATDVSLGIYEGETAEDAIHAMLVDASAADEVMTTIEVVAAAYGVEVPDCAEPGDTIRLYRDTDQLGDGQWHAAHPWDDDWAPTPAVARDLAVQAAIAEGVRAVEVVYPARDGRPSEEAECETCGRGGYVSDWPGNDPANRRATVRVLCADIRGRLICDECADEAGGTWTIDRDGVWVGDWTLEGTVADLGDLQDEMDAALVAAEEAGDFDTILEVGPYRARRL